MENKNVKEVSPLFPQCGKKLQLNPQSYSDHILNNVGSHLEKLEILTDILARGWGLVGEAEFGDHSLQMIIIS